MMQVSIADIVSLVTREWGVSVTDISSARREPKLVEARRVVCWLARQLTPLSYVQIGIQIGCRDHSTIITGCRWVQQQRATDPAFAARVDAIIAVCRDVYQTVHWLDADPLQAAERIANEHLVGSQARRALQASLREIVAMALLLLHLDEIAQGTAALILRAPHLLTDPATADFAEVLQSALVQTGHMIETSDDAAA
jgi:chromosomal replication initiator protein